MFAFPNNTLSRCSKITLQTSDLLFMLFTCFMFYAFPIPASAFNLLLIRDLRSYQISKLSRFLPQIVIASLFFSSQLSALELCARHNNPRQVYVCVCMYVSIGNRFLTISELCSAVEATIFFSPGTGLYCNHRGTPEHCTYSISILDLLKNAHSTHHPRGRRRRPRPRSQFTYS